MRSQDFYDRVQILEFLLQLMTLDWATKDASNNQLMEELQKQDREYLETVIKQNNKILEYLSNKND